MYAFVTDQFRILNAGSFVESISNNSYYAFLGLSNPTDPINDVGDPAFGRDPNWDTSTTNNPVDNFQYLSHYRDTSLFGKRITTENARRVIRKLNPKSCTPALMSQMSTIAATCAALGLAALAMEIKKEIRGSERETNFIDLISAIGLPLVGETSLSGYIGGPAVSIVDDFLASVYGNGLAETLAETPEQFFDIILRATVGALGAEAFKED